MQAIVPVEYLDNLKSLLEWAIPGRRLKFSEGILEFHQKLRGKYIPFLRWQEAVKAKFREMGGLQNVCSDYGIGGGY